MAIPEIGMVAFIDTDRLTKGASVIKDSLGGVTRDLEQTEDSSAGAGGALDALGGVASGVATGGITLLLGALTTVATTLIGVSTAGLKFATEFGGVMRDVEAQTGATGAELEAFRNITEEVYQTGLGESFADVAQAMVQVEQMTGAAGQELQTLTTNALTMSQVFDVDVAESVRAVDQAMIAFGAEGTDVFDMMTATIQATGDPMDDLADTINEYASIFGEAGFSAEEMFAVLNAGLEAGAFNFDKVGDAVKEFFIRIQDGSDSTADALTALFAAPGDEVDVLQDRIEELNIKLEEDELAVQAAQYAWESAEGAWAASQEVIKKLESALNEARMELNELAHPNLAGMTEFDDQIFGLEQNVKKARLAMLDMEKDTPEFDAAKEQLDGMNKELEKLRLAKDIQYDASFRELEKAVEAGTTEIVTQEEALAQIAAKKGEIAGLEGSLWNAQVAEAAAAAEAEAMNHAYEIAAENFAMTEETIADVTAALEAAGTPAQEFLAELQAGAITGPEAMSKVLQALKDVDDQVKQNEIGVALFGSPWEDLGKEVILAMDPAEAALLAFEGATGDAQGAISTGLGPAWEKLQRVLQVVLADGFAPVLAMLVENVTPAFEAFAEWLKGDGRAVLERFGKLITDNLAPALEKLGPFIEKKVIPALEEFADWMIKEGFPAVQKFITWLVKKGIPGFKKFIDFIIKKVIPALDKLIHPFKPIQETIDDTIEKFEQMKEDVGEALDRLLGIVEDVWSDIGDFIDTTLDKIGSIIADKWAEFLSIITGFLEDIGSIIEDKWDEFWSTISDFLDKIGSIIADKWAEFLSIITGFLEDIGSIIADKWAEFLSIITGFLEDIGSIISTKWAEFWSIISGFLEDIGSIISTKWAEFLSIITGALADIGNEISTRWAEFVAIIVEALANIIAEVVTWAVELYNTVRDALLALAAIPAEIMDTLTQIGADIIAFIIQGIQAVTTFVSDIVAQFVTWFTDLLGQIPSISQIFDIGLGLIQRIIDGIFERVDGEHPIKTAIQGVIVEAANTVKGSLSDVVALFDAGKEIVQQLINGILDKAGALWNALCTILNDAIDNAIPGPGPRPFPCPSGASSQSAGGAGQVLNYIGQSMVAGMAQGIYDGSHWVAQAAVWTVQNALNAAQHAAGVRSPSALFAALGHDLMAGLQAGMAAQMPAISAQVSAAVTAPALVHAPALGAAGNTSIVQNFNVGGNTINSGVDEAIFEARVVNVIRRNMSGAGGGLL